MVDYYRDRAKANRTKVDGRRFRWDRRSGGARELRDLVRGALDRLMDQDREIIRLAYFDQASTEEIAAVFGCSANAAYVRLHRALKRLKAVLEENTNEMG